MSKLKQLEAFVKVIETNSFAEAATKLFITPAAVSKQIKALESDLGVELIKRNTRSLKLTEAGALYFQEAKLILDKLAEADHAIRSTKREPAGALHVLSTRYYAEHFILDRLADFLERHPKIKLKLELAERLPDLMREDIDILFGVTLKPSNADLNAQPLDTTRYVFCAAPAYLKKFGTPKQPNDLKLHRYLTHSMRQKPDFVSFKHYPEVYVEPYLYLNDSKALRQCALQGMGIVKLHNYFVDTDLANGNLVEVLPNTAEVNQAVFAYYRTARALDPKIQAFVGFFLLAHNN